MRNPVSLLLLTAWAVTRIAQAQTAAAPPAAPQPTTATRQAVGQDASPTTAPHSERQPAHVAGRVRAGRSSARDASSRKTHARAPGAKGDDVLSLGASDITGNKELPKVMVIVPWKSSSGADGVIKPENSLMNEVLGPVDRGVFQRRIRYYRQLDGAQAPAASQGSEGDIRKP